MSEDPKLITRTINFELVQPICSAYINVTDRQRDRQTDGRAIYDSNTALALRASRGKNCSECCRRTLNQKQQLQHRVVSLRHHGFLVGLARLYFKKSTSQFSQTCLLQLVTFLRNSSRLKDEYVVQFHYVGRRMFNDLIRSMMILALSDHFRWTEW